MFTAASHADCRKLQPINPMYFLSFHKTSPSITMTSDCHRAQGHTWFLFNVPILVCVLRREPGLPIHPEKKKTRIINLHYINVLPSLPQNSFLRKCKCTLATTEHSNVPQLQSKQDRAHLMKKTFSLQGISIIIIIKIIKADVSSIGERCA